MTDVRLDHPLIVTGLGRSGTGLVREILRAHPQIYGIPQETRYLREFLSTFPASEVAVDDALAFLTGKSSFPHTAFDMTWLRQELGRSVVSRLEFVQVLFQSALRTQGGKPRLLLKDPDAVLALDEIDTVLPDSQIIVCTRDPRAVLASMREFIPSRSRLSTVEVWNQSVDATDRWVAVNGVRTLRLKYEDLLGETERVVREMCAFAGLEFHKEMLHFRQPIGVSAPPGVIERSRELSWRKTLEPEEICYVEKRCESRMRALGYSLESNLGTSPVYLKLAFKERMRRTFREIRRAAARTRNSIIRIIKTPVLGQRRRSGATLQIMIMVWSAAPEFF